FGLCALCVLCGWSFAARQQRRPRYTEPVVTSRRILVLLLAGACASIISAQRAGEHQGLDPALVQELRYRLVGPFRAGRTVGGMGVPSQPGVFYAGVNNGGVWKT